LNLSHQIGFQSLHCSLSGPARYREPLAFRSGLVRPEGEEPERREKNDKKIQSFDFHSPLDSSIPRYFAIRYAPIHE
jgi:hypothetical protein